MSAVEVELDLETDAGASRIGLGFSDTLRAAEDVERDERTVAAEFARETEDGTFDRTESFLVTEGDGGAPGTIAEGLERDVVLWTLRALAEEFAREVDEGMPLVLREDKIVFVLVAFGGAAAVELVLDTGAAAECTFFMESVRDTGGTTSLGGLGGLEAEWTDAEETVEGALATFAVPVVWTVATELVLDMETVEDLGLNADLMLGSGSSR